MIAVLYITDTACPTPHSTCFARHFPLKGTAFKVLLRVRLPQRCDRIFTLIDSYTHLSKSYLHSKYDSRIRGKRKGERLTFKTAHAAPTIKNYPSRRLTSSSIFKKAFYFAKLRKLHLRSNAIWKVAVCIFLL